MRTYIIKRNQPQWRASVTVAGPRAAPRSSPLCSRVNGAPFAHDFTRIPVGAGLLGTVPALPAVGSPQDRREQDADLVAEAATRMPDPTAQVTRRGQDPAPTQPMRVLPGAFGSGKPLPDAVRSYFEPRFGHDFSRVRVHAGPQAALSATALGARAYTLGHDVVFGGGQYAPETGEGRRLLAHELAHVVQQSQADAGPMIQRRLLVTGDKADVQAMFGLLQPASGLTLKHDSKTHEVSITSSGGKPQSPELASRLQTIINDRKQDAEIHLGRKQGDVSFGKFPDPAEPGEPQTLVQEIRIDDMLALEKGAPGSGVTKLAHEIIENYEGHPLLGVYNWSVAFSESHEKAVEAENVIETEMGHPGERRAQFMIDITSPGKGKPFVVRWIEDRGKEFLVWDTKSGKVLNARRVRSVPVSTYQIGGFTVGSSSLPTGGDATIDKLALDLRANPTASALVEGSASAGKTDAENKKLALEWGNMVMEEVADKDPSKVTLHWRRFHVVGNAGKTANSVTITVQRPDL